MNVVAAFATRAAARLLGAGLAAWIGTALLVAPLAQAQVQVPAASGAELARAGSVGSAPSVPAEVATDRTPPSSRSSHARERDEIVGAPVDVQAGAWVARDLEAAALGLATWVQRAIRDRAAAPDLDSVEDGRPREADDVDLSLAPPELEPAPAG